VAAMSWISLPYPISANRYWATRVAGKFAQTYVTPEAKAYKAHVAQLVALQGVKCSSDRMMLTIRLYPNRPQDWLKRVCKDPDRWDDTVQCIDLGNCEKVLSDALNGVAWTDDKQLRRITLERMEPDEHGARVEILIEPVVFVPMVPALFDAELVAG
jgi:crossover junction endodeoxyribonuclease RusA